MLTQISERLGKGGQGPGVPSCLPHEKRLTLQQLLSNNGDQRKEARASAGVVRRIARSARWRCASTPT